MRLDLADPGSICDFVRAFTSAYKICDILVNNAGVMFPPFQLTDWVRVPCIERLNRESASVVIALPLLRLLL